MKKILLLVFLLCSQFNGFAQQDTIFSFFNVQQEQDRVVVIFTIRGGIQCSGLQVQRSIDNFNFQQVYEFPGICGSPSADETYIWTDENPNANKENFYRLELGSLGIVSSVKSIFFYATTPGKILLFPNPCSSCTIRFLNDQREKVQVSIYDLLGQLISEDVTSEDYYQFKSSEKSGMFLTIKIVFPNGREIFGKFIQE